MTDKDKEFKIFRKVKGLEKIFNHLKKIVILRYDPQKIEIIDSEIINITKN